MKRRSLDFRSAEDVIEDIEMLRATAYSKLGNWNLTQVCEHLSGTMKGGMNGFGFRIPWIFRATIARWGFRWALRRRYLPSRFPTFKMLRPANCQTDDNDKIIDGCIRECRRAAEFDGSLENYALLDNLAVDDWREFMWIHAAHHLSFLVPKSE